MYDRDQLHNGSPNTYLVDTLRNSDVCSRAFRNLIHSSNENESNNNESDLSQVQVQMRLNEERIELLRS
jgi:hypothetical protein